MTDVRIKQLFTLEGPTMDWFLRDNGDLDDREELVTSVRLALGTDSLSDISEILPDPDSTDRRGWWGDMDAEFIWGGWPIGCKNWLLTRAKITEAPSSEGSTIERAKRYTINALQPLVDKRICSQIIVDAFRTELNRIEVHAIIYRGPLAEIDLRYQILWQEDEVFDIPFLAHINKLINPLSNNLFLSTTVPSVTQNLITSIPQANLFLSPTNPTVLNSLIQPPAGNLVISSDPGTSQLSSAKPMKNNDWPNPQVRKISIPPLT